MATHPKRGTRSHLKTNSVVIYCDGACSGNQFGENVGGWGAILSYQGKTKELHGGERNTTNQRMEIMACIEALQQLRRNDLPVDLYSDSAYVVNCMQEKWYKQWERNGWKNTKKQPVENQDLWSRLVKLVGALDVRFHKVTGHSGITMNERADQLARQGIREVR